MKLSTQETKDSAKGDAPTSPVGRATGDEAAAEPRSGRAQARGILRGRSGRALRAGATLLLLYHCAAVTAANLPRRTVFSNDVHAPFRDYLNLTYQWQIWNMFTERPLLLSIDPKVVATWKGGRTEQMPPILPGFEEYTGELKHYAFLARVLPSGDNTRDTKAYGQALCRAFIEKFGSEPAHVQLVIETMALRSPSEVRKTGELASPRTQRGGFRKCQ